MKTKDVGTITAYGYACDYGELDPREVSEREFGERLASYMTVAQEAADSAGRAVQAANAAGQILGQTTSARDAAISAKNDAVSAKDTAAESANVAGRYEAQAESAKTDAESARDAAVEAVDGFAAGAQQALESVNEAGANWKSLAEKQAGNSEAWAVGQRGGEDVPTTDATYHNNAKYYAEQASGEKTSAETARQGAETAATNASESATAADRSASQAAQSARAVSDITKSLTTEPIVINMADYFWANGAKVLSNSITTDEDAINKYLVVSGNTGDDTLMIEASSPLAIADLYNGTISGVLEYADGSVDLVSLYPSNGVLSIYPPLKSDISSAKIYSAAVGIHLTTQGYRYYADCLFNAERKYTRKSKAIAQYNPFADITPNPMTKIGSPWWGKGVANIISNSQRVISNFTTMFLDISLSTGATAQSPKGFKWGVTLDNKNGYFEMYLGGKDANNYNAEFDSGLELNIEFYLDGALAESRVKKTKTCEPVRFDFSGAQTGEIRVYVTSGASNYHLYLIQATWWETDDDGGAVFDDFTVPCLLMDSWGVYCNNAMENRLKALLTKNGMTGFTINKSVGGMTSNWGVANFYERVWAEHPNYMITDFQINDANTGVAQEQYIANMKQLLTASVNSRIIPVLILNGHVTLSGNYSIYSFPLLASLAEG